MLEEYIIAGLTIIALIVSYVAGYLHGQRKMASLAVQHLKRLRGRVVSGDVDFTTYQTESDVCIPRGTRVGTVCVVEEDWSDER